MTEDQHSFNVSLPEVTVTYFLIADSKALFHLQFTWIVATLRALLPLVSQTCDLFHVWAACLSGPPSVSQMTPAQRHLFMFLPSGAQQVFSVRDQIVNILGFIDHGVPSINALFFSLFACLLLLLSPVKMSQPFLVHWSCLWWVSFCSCHLIPFSPREFFPDCSSYPLSTIQYPPGTQLPKETCFLYPIFPLEGS